MKYANNIILIFVIFLTKILLNSFGKHEETEEIHFVTILHNCLQFPLLLVITNFFSKPPTLKSMVIFILIWVGINLILGYYYEDGFFNYNYLIGNIVGIVLATLIYPLLSNKKENQEN